MQSETVNMSSPILLNDDSNLSTNTTTTSEISVPGNDDSASESETVISFIEDSNIARENYEFIAGHRSNSRLIYLKWEKCLYTPVNKDKYGHRFKCQEKECNARILLKSDGECVKSSRNVNHIVHGTHQRLRSKLLAMDKMKQDCASVDVLCGSASQTVSVRAVFNSNVVQ